MFADDKNVRLENDKRVKNYVEYYFSEGMLKHLLRIKPERDFYDEFCSRNGQVNISTSMLMDLGLR